MKAVDWIALERESFLYLVLSSVAAIFFIVGRAVLPVCRPQP